MPAVTQWDNRKTRRNEFKRDDSAPSLREIRCNTATVRENWVARRKAIPRSNGPASSATVAGSNGFGFRSMLRKGGSAGKQAGVSLPATGASFGALTNG